MALLSQIPDPEIPVLTITDLGMVRNVTQMGEGWVIGFTRLIPVVRNGTFDWRDT